MKRVLSENINTKKYWDDLLSNEKWGEGRGSIYKILLKYLPKTKLTLLDIGCANGYGTIELKKGLPNAQISGCDFSSEGIKIAKQKYGNKIKFFVHDVTKDELGNKYDYILFIETLEHLDNPKKIVKKYLKNCKNMIVTVPYHERGWEEHVYSFDEKSFKDIKEFKEFHVFDKPGTDMQIILYLFKH